MLRTTADTGCASRRAHPVPLGSAGLDHVIVSATATPPHLVPPHLLLGLDPLQLPRGPQLVLALDHLPLLQDPPPHRWVRDLDQLLLAVVLRLD